MMVWDEEKRQKNLEKHGLDFVDAGLVFRNCYRLEFQTVRNGQLRQQTFAYVAEALTVLTVVWVPGPKRRVISFRRAHRYEREAYYDWLEKDFEE